METDDITEERLKALVERFYDRVRQDPLIGPVFNDAIEDWPEHLEKLQAFWSSVMLSSGRYKGRPLPVHARHGERISAASFDRWLTLWRETTEQMMPPCAAAAMQEKAARIAESLSLGIAFCAGRRDRAASCPPVIDGNSPPIIAMSQSAAEKPRHFKVVLPTGGTV
ncbi:group III truncated hemoglobin [Sphingomonas cannabina]|uniref:group III truncated hemoglobin n=1 Tax=Sphingomonas cannabina TaxID=2899123 RepID=UPI003873425F